MTPDAITKPPLREIGTEGFQAGVLPWNSYIDVTERVPELIWPRSLEVYEAMRTDTQIAGLLQGMTMPIRRMRWCIDPNGADPMLVEKLAADFSLPIKGSEGYATGRPRKRFDWDDFLKHVLLMLPFGYMPFEQVGMIDDEGFFRYTKLAPRMPKSIYEIKVAPDGGLISVRQNIGLNPQPIPVERLVWFAWEREGAQWVGRSILRPSYRNWYVKDRLIRIDAMRHERAGVPLNIGKPAADADASRQRMLAQMSQAMRAGELAGGSLGPGDDMMTLPQRMTLTDIMESLRFHNQEMAKSLLMQFIELGQTETGSRALGETFTDFFSMSLDTIADSICGVFNRHVIEDWWDWNTGDPTLVTPLLTAEQIENRSYPTDELVNLINAGVVQVDNELEDFIRAKGLLPDRMADESASSSNIIEQRAARKRRRKTKETPTPAYESITEATDIIKEVRTAVANNTTLPKRGLTARIKRLLRAENTDTLPPGYLPDRDLRRAAYPWEVQAKVNYKAMEDAHKAELEKLFQIWMSGPRKLVIASVRDRILDANGDLAKLGEIAADAHGASDMEAAFRSIARTGAETSVSEAKNQGRSIRAVDMNSIEDRLVARASAVESILAKGIAAAASNRALRLTGETTPANVVAQDVEDHLLGLEAARERQQLAGALWQSLNTGRFATADQANPTKIYASEILDTNTCEPCAAIDGEQYGSIDDAEGDYPTGGFNECLGGDACRGTLVFVYDEAPATEARVRDVLTEKLNEVRDIVAAAPPPVVNVHVDVAPAELPKSPDVVVHNHIPEQRRPVRTRRDPDGSMVVEYEGD